MNCSKIEPWLHGLADGQLAPWRVWLLRRHVAKCAVCAEYLERIERLRGLLADHAAARPVTPEPDMFWPELKRRIAAATGQPGRAKEAGAFKFEWVYAAGAAAMVALGVVLALVFVSPTGPRDMAAPTVIATSGPELYAEAYHSDKARATIIWTEGMPVLSLQL